MNLIKIGEVCHESNTCRIIHLKNINCILLEWKRYSTSKEMRENAVLATQYIVQKGVNSLITDNREAKVIGEDDRHWTSHEWMPDAIRKGLSLSAVIESENIFNRVSTDALLKEFDQEELSLRNQVFKNLDDAISWIKEQSELR